MNNHTPQLTQNTTEEWRDIVGYEGYYQVSSTGRVRTVPHEYKGKNNSVRSAKGRMLKMQIGKNGYFAVNLSKLGIVNLMYVHRLVAQTFFELPLNEYHVHHKDENKLNNHVSNLEFLDASVHHRLHNTGERARAAKLNRKQVKKIRELLETDISQRRISEMFGVTEQAICQIKYRRNWAWLED